MRYPFFVTDLVLLALLIASILAAFAYPGPVSAGLALVAAVLTAVFAKRSHDAMADFSRCAEGIEGLGWKPAFLSMGRLELEYKGTKMGYSSSILPEKDGALPVEYRITAASGSKELLEVIGSDKPGEPEVRGERKLYERIRGPVSAFDSKYGLGSLRNRDNALEFSVCLGFSKEPMPKDEKLEDMTAFLTAYISLAHEVGKALS